MIRPGVGQTWRGLKPLYSQAQPLSGLRPALPYPGRALKSFTAEGRCAALGRMGGGVLIGLRCWTGSLHNSRMTYMSPLSFHPCSFLSNGFHWGTSFLWPSNTLKGTGERKPPAHLARPCSRDAPSSHSTLRGRGLGMAGELYRVVMFVRRHAVPDAFSSQCSSSQLDE